MADRDEILRLLRHAKSAVDDIESKADEIVGNPAYAADEIRSLADDASTYLRRLKREIESL